jgi:FAD/FMN-containing dehydrogenase
VRTAHEHGLAVPCGVISTTGVGGLTLGGGLGHLTRGYGLTIDNLLAAEVVLADGQRVTASPDREPDLFWALRGGGGNFGVVTEFTFRCHRVADVVGGPTFWPIEQTGEVLTAYRELLPQLPRNASAFFAFHTVPPAPPFPAEIHMRKVCGVVWCIVGSEEEAERLMAPLLAVGTPLMHGAGRVPLPAFNNAFDPVYGTGDQWYWRADFVDSIPDQAIAANERWATNMPSWKSGSHIYPIDGAASDIGADETAWAYRGTRWAQVIVGVDPDPMMAPALKDWTTGYWEALHPYSAEGAYVNFLMDEGRDRVRATYGANYDRLARTKATYDPHNLFRINQNITPAG